MPEELLRIKSGISDFSGVQEFPTSQSRMSSAVLPNLFFACAATIKAIASLDPFEPSSLIIIVYLFCFYINGIAFMHFLSQKFPNLFLQQINLLLPGFTFPDN